MDEYGKENPKTLTLHDVKIGENYAIIISTNGGLWRYMIGDTVKFGRVRYKVIAIQNQKDGL